MGTFVHMMLEHVKSRKGQGMVEYGLIIGFIAIVLVSVLSMIHEPITQIFASVAAALGANAP